MLAELDLFFIRTFNGKELYSILPERQEMDFIIGSIQSGCCYQLVDFLHILHINGNMVDGTGFHFCSFVLVRLDHKISKLQESNLLIGSPRSLSEKRSQIPVLHKI